LRAREQAVDKHTSQRLIEQSNQNLVDLLKVDIGLGMEFAKSAKYRKKTGDLEGCDRSKRNAIRVLETIAHFEGRIRPEYKHEIRRLRDELREFISTI